MSTVNNSEFNTYLSQLQGIYSNMGTSGSSGSAYINSIFGAAGSVDQIANGNDQQKAAGIQSLVNNIMSILDKLMANEAQSATRETQKNAKTAAEVGKKQQKAEADLDRDVTEVTKEVDEQKEVLTNASNTIATVSEELKAKQEEAAKIEQEILAKQEALANAKTPEEKAALLEELQGLTGEIVSITSSMADIQSKVDSATADAESSMAQIDASQVKVAEIQQAGQDNINEIAQQGVNEIQNNVGSKVKAAENRATAQAAQAAATAASSNFITGTSAPKLQQIAIDQNAAAATRDAGAVTNLQSVMQGVGGLNNNVQKLAAFQTAIGMSYNEYTDATGAWGASLTVVITSIGSFVGEDSLQTSNESLQEAIKTDMQTVTNSGKADESEEGTENPNSDSSSELLTPNVKLKTYEV